MEDTTFEFEFNKKRSPLRQIYEMDVVFGIYPNGKGKIIKSRGLGINHEQILELFTTYITEFHNASHIDIFREGIKIEIKEFLTDLSNKYIVKDSTS